MSRPIMEANNNAYLVLQILHKIYSLKIFAILKLVDTINKHCFMSRGCPIPYFCC